jgi:hypothetical protein
MEETAVATDDDITSQLNKLAPDARARVSDALKANVAAELSGQAIAPQRAAEFSKGAFFSRSKTPSALEDATIVQHAATMDAPTFAKFAQNLQSLKNAKGTTGT